MPILSSSSLDGLARTSVALSDDLLLPEETVKVLAEAREFAESALQPRATELNDAIESKAVFPPDIPSAIAEACLYAVPFAADVGGRGLQFPMLAAATVGTKSNSGASLASRLGAT